MKTTSILLIIISLVLCSGCTPYRTETKKVTDRYTLTVRMPLHRSMTAAEKDILSLSVSPSITAFINDAQVNDVTTNECYVDYTIDQFSAATASVLFSVYTFTGGAHGNTQLIACNYDRRTLRPLSLSELVPSLSLQVVSREAIRQLAPELTRCEDKTLGTAEKTEWQRAQMQWLQEGVAPITKNFQVFTFNKRRLRIYFGQYQVACYAQGIRTIDIPRNTSPSDILRP